MRRTLITILALIVVGCGGADEGADTTGSSGTTGAVETTAGGDPTEATETTGASETTSVASNTTASESTVGSQETVPVSLRLNWVVAGNHAPFYLAAQEGFWAQCGLEVSMAAGQGSGDTAQIVGTGTEEFGLTDAVSITAGRSQGLPIKSIGVVYEDNPSSLVSYAETGITSLEDVEGMTYGAVPGGSPYLLLHALWDQLGVDVSTVREASVPAPGIAQLKTGQADFITYFGNEAANIELDTSLLNIVYFRDAGLESYGLALASQDEYIEANPSHVECMVEGVRQGLEAAQADPEAALAALYEAVPETRENEDVHEALLDGVFPFLGDDVLSQTAEKWAATQDVLLDAGVIGEEVEPESLFVDVTSD
ncbi:MAG: hypothetical protein GEU79_13910 [Acidimicrobiia bacterium]|nr:hypothetical protein [Acidimicrobiia bacterium]